MAEIQRRETQWATMEPDIYAGPNCDKIAPQWRVYASGDKQDDVIGPELRLSGRTFPPGTKIVISEPLCPNCGELRSPRWPTPKRGPLFDAKCECGFDWDGWTRDEYS